MLNAARHIFVNNSFARIMLVMDRCCKIDDATYSGLPQAMVLFASHHPVLHHQSSIGHARQFLVVRNDHESLAQFRAQIEE